MWKIRVGYENEHEEKISTHTFNLECKDGDAFWLATYPQSTPQALDVLLGKNAYPIRAEYYVDGRPVSSELFSEKSVTIPMIDLPSGMRDESFSYVWEWLMATFSATLEQREQSVKLLKSRGLIVNKRMSWSATPERLRSCAMALAAGWKKDFWIVRAESQRGFQAESALRTHLPHLQELCQETKKSLVFCGPRMPRGLTWKRVNWQIEVPTTKDWFLWGETDDEAA